MRTRSSSHVTSACTTIAKMPYMMMAKITAKSTTEPFSASTEGKMPLKGANTLSALRYTHWVNSASVLALKSSRKKVMTSMITAAMKYA